MKKLSLSMIAFLAVLAAPTALAAAPAATTAVSAPTAVSGSNLKVAIVDVQAVLQQSPQMDAVNAQLKKQFDPQEQQIVAAQKKLKSDEDSLQSGGAKMTQAQLATMQQQVATERSQLEQQFVTFRQSLIAAHDKAMQGVIVQINAAITAIAQKNGYNLVLQKQGVLYADGQYDITAQVIAALKAQK